MAVERPSSAIVSATGSVISALAVVVQLFASVTVTAYVPGPRLLKLALVWLAIVVPSLVQAYV